MSSPRLRDRLKEAVREVARRWGYEIVSHSYMRNHELRRDKLLADLGTDLVIDGGANRGQYGKRLRAGGYRGQIVSFEPIPEVFAQLTAASASDPRWSCCRAALGAADGEADIHIAEFDQVSSLLPATGAAGTSSWRASRSERVSVVPLATVLEQQQAATHRTHLKLDLQGYEMTALLGAGSQLADCSSLEVELSTIPLYEGASTAPHLLSYLETRGFDIFSLQPSAVENRSGRVLELESLFVRRSGSGAAEPR
jgi:FkbM family methyltransferase